MLTAEFSREDYIGCIFGFIFGLWGVINGGFIIGASAFKEKSPRTLLALGVPTCGLCISLLLLTSSAYILFNRDPSAIYSESICPLLNILIFGTVFTSALMISTMEFILYLTIIHGKTFSINQVRWFIAGIISFSGLFASLPMILAPTEYTNSLSELKDFCLPKWYLRNTVITILAPQIFILFGCIIPIIAFSLHKVESYYSKKSSRKPATLKMRRRLFMFKFLAVSTILIGFLPYVLKVAYELISGMQSSMLFSKISNLAVCFVYSNSPILGLQADTHFKRNFLDLVEMFWPKLSVSSKGIGLQSNGQSDTAQQDTRAIVREPSASIWQKTVPSTTPDKLQINVK